MAYEWEGMEKITFEEAKVLHERGELVGCYKLNPDNTESYIEEDYDFDDIVRHYEAGGEIGYEKDVPHKYECKNCNSEFDVPEVKMPDAGFTNGIGILGMKKMDPVKFCPECFSTKIEEVNKVC